MLLISAFTFLILNRARASLVHEAISRNDTKGVLTFLLSSGGFVAEEDEVDVNAKNRKHFTALHVAVFMNNFEACEYLIKSGANVNSGDATQASPLHHATSVNNIGLVNLLLRMGANVNHKNASGKTASHIAAERGFGEVFRALMLNSRGRIKLNARDNAGWSTYHYAAHGGHSEIIDLLAVTETWYKQREDRNYMTALQVAIKAGHTEAAMSLLNFYDAGLWMEDIDGMTSGHYAAQYARKKVLIAIVNKGYHLEKKDRKGNTLLLSAVTRPDGHGENDDGVGDRVQIVKALILLGANVNAVNVDGKNGADLAMELEDYAAHAVIINEISVRSVSFAKIIVPRMHYAIVTRQADREMIRNFLLTENMDETDYLDRTAARLAVQTDNAEVLEELISAGCDLTRRNVLGNNVLHVTKRADIARLLLWANPELANVANGEGNLALHVAVFDKLEEVAEILARATRDVDAVNDRKYSPLKAAAELGNSRMVEILLKRGAGRYERCKGTITNTAVHNAAGKGHVEIARLLVKYGQDVTIRNWAGTLAAHFAAKSSDDPELMSTLLEGVDANATDMFGFSLLHYAALFQPSGGKVAKFLIQYGVPMDLKTYRGRTALYMAVKKDNLPLVEVLINHGANVALTTPVGKTAIHAAIRGMSIKCVSVLANADRNVLKKRDVRGLTPVDVLLEFDVTYPRAKFIALGLELTAGDVPHYGLRKMMIFMFMGKFTDFFIDDLREVITFEDYVQRGIREFKQRYKMEEKSPLEVNLSRGLGFYYDLMAAYYPHLSLMELPGTGMEGLARKRCEYQKAVKAFETGKNKRTFFNELRCMLVDSFMSQEGRKRLTGTYMNSIPTELIDDTLVGVINNGNIWGRMEVYASTMMLTFDKKEELQGLDRLLLQEKMAGFSEMIIPKNKIYKRISGRIRKNV